MSQIKVTAPNKAVVLQAGVGLVRLAAKEERALPVIFAEAALAEGCEVDGEVPDTVKAPATDRLKQIAEAMQTIMDADDKSLLTASGEPRAKEVENLVGFDTDADERDAAWELVQGA